ncbi:Signal peptidase II [Sorangium cellulosum]|uniref:Lipoprotein signal peptidase n=1 Tax=Sorangium cellulosum TaxID=56 RepID=A0A150QWI0_SORCE|nr:Signal peptidase II [Sorangium cellulosum]
MSSDGPHAPHGVQAPRASTAAHLPDEVPPGERASLTFMAIVALVSCAADLATKAWAHARLAGFDAKRAGAKVFTVIPDHLDFIFAQNPGGAWSFLRSLPDGLRRPFFLFVSAAATVFIVSIYRRVHRDQTAMKWGLSLALGGAMGNLVDRIRYGWVIDFIDVYVSRGGQEFHWPTFNVADIAIVAGVILMSSDMIASARSAPAPDAGGGAARPAGGDAGAPLSTEAPPPAPPAG